MRFATPNAWKVVSWSLLIFLLSCAGPRSYTMHLRSMPSHTHEPSSSMTLGLTPFLDARSAAQNLGRRFRWDGKQEPIVAESPSLSEDVTRIIRHYVEDRGCRVVHLDSWDLDPEGLKGLPEEVQVAMAGRIDAIEVEARSTLWRTTTRYTVRLTAYLGLKGKKELLTRSIEVSPEESYLRFDPQEMEDRLNRALSEALDHLLEGVIHCNNQAK